MRFFLFQLFLFVYWAELFSLLLLVAYTVPLVLYTIPDALFSFIAILVNVIIYLSLKHTSPTMLHGVLPFLGSLLKLKSDSFSDFDPNKSFVFVYICVPENSGHTQWKWEHELFEDAFRLYFRILQCTQPVPVVLAPGITVISKDLHQLHVDSDAREWTMKQAKLILQWSARSRIHACPLVIPGPLSSEGVTKLKSHYSHRFVKDVTGVPIDWTAESVRQLALDKRGATENLSEIEAKTIALSGKVLNNLLYCYNCGMSDIEGAPIPAIPVKKDEQQHNNIEPIELITA